MKILSALATRLSGSIGGLTGSHNRGGMYLRGRSMPTNPNTPAQQTVREFFASLTAQWSQLTPEQRQSWAEYAANVPVQNKMGGQSNITGANMFVRCNAPRLTAGLAVILSGPTEFNLGSTPLITAFGAAEGGTSDVAFTRTDTAPAATGIFFLSRSYSPTINYFRGPYLFAGTETIAAAAPNPLEVNLVQPPGYIEGQKVFVRAVISYADGRLSAEAQASTIVIGGA
jgi:hypothetical protein